MFHFDHFILVMIAYFALVFGANHLWSRWVTAVAIRAVKQGRRSNIASDTAPVMVVLVGFSAVLFGLLIYYIH